MATQSLKWNKIKKIYSVVCLFLVPIITIIMIGTIHYGVNKYLVLYVIPVFLIVWGVTLLFSFTAAIVHFLRDDAKSDPKKLLLFGVSLGIFCVCCFCGLFARSILSGGFHAS